LSVLDAVVFDLYGTLLHITRKRVAREIPRHLGARPATWMELLRGELLVRPFADDAALVHFVAETLAPERAPGAEAAAVACMDDELASVVPAPGVLSLLSFLKRRGLKLGALSNLASPYKAALSSAGIDVLLDAAGFSCDEGITKPDPEIYRRLLRRLEVEPERTLFVGDSKGNDVETPAALGLLTAGIGVSGGDVTLGAAADLGLLDLSARPFEPLLAPGRRVRVGDLSVEVKSFLPVDDDEQGRYNLVYAVDSVDLAGVPWRLFVKRFLLPETAYVEEFAYRLQAETGLGACEVSVLEGPEPLLLMTEAPGRKLNLAVVSEAAPGGAAEIASAKSPATRSEVLRSPATRMNSALAFEVGRHFGFGFLFSNADLRPRNSFLLLTAQGPRLTVVDMEHCLFNLAIETEGLARPERPETFDELPQPELLARVKRRVLTRKTSPRAKRTFLTDAARGSEIGQAFDAGFLDFYRRQQRRAGELCALISARVHAEPPLVIGTHAYRRAMAEADVEDIRQRLAMSAEDALEWMW